MDWTIPASLVRKRNPIRRRERKNYLSPLGVLKEFSQESTLHGLRYITKDSSNIFDRLCWIAATLACAVLGIVFINSAWDNFSKVPIIVNVETTNYPLYKLPFPAITICPAVNVKRTIGENLLERYMNRTLDDHLRERFRHVLSGLSVFQFPFYYRVGPHFNLVKDLLRQLNNFTVSDFMLQVLPTCHEVFKDCFWTGYAVNCCTVFHLQRTEAGFCYSFNSLTSEITRNCSASDEFFFDDGLNRERGCSPRHNIASGSATGLEVFLDKIPEWDSLGEGQLDPNGARIMIHHPMAPPESGKSIYMPEKIASTFSVKISPVVTECSPEVRGLDMSTRNCMFPDEHHIKYFKTYTLQGCLIECRMKWLIDKCGCHPYFYDFEQDGAKECKISQLPCLAKENTNLRVYNPPPGYKNLNAEQGSAVLNCSNCLPTCHDNTFLVDYDMVPDTDPTTKESTGHIDVFYNEMGAIKYRRERAFSLMQLIVSFGGIMGLFLGVSLLSGVEVIYYMLRICMATYIKIQQRGKQEPNTKNFLVSKNKVPALKALSFMPPIDSDYTNHYIKNI